MLKVSENPPMLPQDVEFLTDLQGDWWVGHTKARSEKAFAWDLLHYSIPYFLPMMQRTAIWGGRKRKVLMPLFSSYVFFCGDQQARYRALTTDRLCNVIPVRERTCFVKELESIRIALGQDMQLDLYPFAVVGRRCKIVKGNLSGIEGTIVRRDVMAEVVLQVSMLGQAASMRVEADFVEPLD